MATKALASVPVRSALGGTGTPRRAQRRGRDSNPRTGKTRSTVFRIAAESASNRMDKGNQMDLGSRWAWHRSERLRGSNTERNLQLLVQSAERREYLRRRPALRTPVAAVVRRRLGSRNSSAKTTPCRRSRDLTPGGRPRLAPQPMGKLRIRPSAFNGRPAAPGVVSVEENPIDGEKKL